MFCFLLAVSNYGQLLSESNNYKLLAVRRNCRVRSKGNSSNIWRLYKETCFDIDIFGCTAEYCDIVNMEKANMLLVSEEGLFCLYLCIVTKLTFVLPWIKMVFHIKHYFTVLCMTFICNWTKDVFGNSIIINFMFFRISSNGKPIQLKFIRWDTELTGRDQIQFRMRNFCFQT